AHAVPDVADASEAAHRVRSGRDDAAAPDGRVRPLRRRLPSRSANRLREDVATLAGIPGSTTATGVSRTFWDGRELSPDPQHHAGKGGRAREGRSARRSGDPGSARPRRAREAVARSLGPGRGEVR